MNANPFLSRSIADCFKEAHESYADIPEVASQIRKGAALCRQQLMESTKMLRKVRKTRIKGKYGICVFLTSHFLSYFLSFSYSLILIPPILSVKVEQTACAVLDMFPDLELAVEEGW